MSTSDAAEREARVRAVRERHARWMRERDSELIRQDAEAELHAEQRSGLCSQTAPLAQGARTSSLGNEQPSKETLTAFEESSLYRDAPAEQQQLNPVAVMERITERLTDKLKVEIREELKRDESARMMMELRQKSQIDGFLAKELETHTCPICYEMMSSPKHTPQLLFPCGHTFCVQCLTSHIDMGRKSTCPFCRSRIDSRATNVSLQQIIQSYLRRRTEVMTSSPTSPSPQPPSAFSPGHAHNPHHRDHPTSSIQNESDACRSSIHPSSSSDAYAYDSRASQLAVRIRILENEFDDNMTELESVRLRHDGVDKVMKHLARERERLTALMSSVQAELALVDTHASEQRQKMERVDLDARELEMRQELVRETIDSLRKEHEKLMLLAAGVQRGLGTRLDERADGTC